MNEDQTDGSYQLTERTFQSVLALVADGRGNALYTGDAKRMAIGASYLRLAARQAVALAEFVEAVATTNVRHGRRAQRRLASIEKAIVRFTETVAVDNARFAREHGAVVVHGKEAETLLKEMLAGCIETGAAH